MQKSQMTPMSQILETPRSFAHRKHGRSMTILLGPALIFPVSHSLLLFIPLEDRPAISAVHSNAL